MSGDVLAIFLFAIAMAVPLALEARKEDGLWRVALFSSAGAFLLLAGLAAFAWEWAAREWPPAAHAVAQLATNPIAWFVLFMAAMVMRAWQRERAVSTTAKLGKSLHENGETAAQESESERRMPGTNSPSAKNSPVVEPEAATQAKTLLVGIARDHFYPTYFALSPLMGTARTQLARHVGVGPTASAIERILPREPPNPMPDISTITSADSARHLTKTQVQSILYNNVAKYRQLRSLTADMLLKGAPYVGDSFTEMKTRFEEWRVLEAAMFDQFRRLKGNIELNIGQSVIDNMSWEDKFPDIDHLRADQMPPSRWKYEGPPLQHLNIEPKTRR